MDTNDNKPQAAKPDDIVLTLVERAQLDALVSHAAEEGARRAICQLGLNKSTGQDAQDLRSLLDQWRSLRRASWLGIVRGASWVLLALLLLDSTVKLAHFWSGR